MIAALPSHAQWKQLTNTQIQDDDLCHLSFCLRIIPVDTDVVCLSVSEHPLLKKVYDQNELSDPDDPNDPIDPYDPNDLNDRMTGSSADD